MALSLGNGITQRSIQKEQAVKTFDDVRNAAILDLPLPLEPVIVDLDRPLEEQLPPGPYLDAAKEMLNVQRPA